MKPLGKPRAIVSDRYTAYRVPIKALHGVRHIRVESFHDDITNNLISMFSFFYNFVRPHSALNGLTPTQCAILNLSQKRKRELPLVVQIFWLILGPIFSLLLCSAHLNHFDK